MINDSTYQTLFTKDKVCNSTQPHITTVTTVVDKDSNYTKKYLVEFTNPIELSSII